jgi:hypothetical protein
MSSMHCRGTLDCASKIIKNEGVGGLFNGALSNTFRGTGAAVRAPIYFNFVAFPEPSRMRGRVTWMMSAARLET